MPRNKRLDLSGVTQLVVQNAYNNQIVMAREADFRCMQYALQIAAECNNTDLHAYSFSAAQIVMLLTPREDRGVSRMMQSLGKRYIVYKNRDGDPMPRLWAGRHRVVPVESERYFLVASHLVEHLHLGEGEYPVSVSPARSSFAENSGGKPLQILTPHSLYEALADSHAARTRVYRAQSQGNDWQRFMGKMKDVVAGRSQLASVDYIRRLERESGVRLIPGRPGRPRQPTRGEGQSGNAVHTSLLT